MSFLCESGGGIISSASRAEDPRHQAALVRLSGDKRFRGNGGVEFVQSQVGLPLVLVRAMTGEAVLGQDRPDVAVELYSLGGG